MNTQKQLPGSDFKEVHEENSLDDYEDEENEDDVEEEGGPPQDYHNRFSNTGDLRVSKSIVTDDETRQPTKGLKLKPGDSSATPNMQFRSFQNQRTIKSSRRSHISDISDILAKTGDSKRVVVYDQNSDRLKEQIVQNQVKMEPVTLPSREDFNYILKKRKSKKAFQNQAILYGVDMLQEQIGLFDDINKEKEAEAKGNPRKSMSRQQTQKWKDGQNYFNSMFQILHLQNEEAAQAHNSQDENQFSKLIISKDSRWKAYFDMIMLFASVYNTFSQAYYAAFGQPEELYDNAFIVNFLDYTIEALFAFDLCFCFCQEYKDEETYTIVSDIKMIAKHYAKGSFFFDLLANIPFELVISRGKQPTSDKSRLYRLLKLFRVPRLFELLNVDRIKSTITDYYGKKFERAVEMNDESESFPILRALMLVQIYKILRLVIIIFTSSYFLGILWHIFVCDLQVTEWIDPTDKSLGPVDPNFRTEKLGKDDPENTDNPSDVLVKVFYFALTTLSTIGYGDFSPVSTLERGIGAFVLLCGVAVFSFIMGQFIDILMNYKSLWIVGYHKDLSQWIALLSRFNNGNPLNKELITKIEDFFNYYWQNNRLSPIQSESGQRFMDELPYYVQSEIFVDYLFTDFLYNYRSYFRLPNDKQIIGGGTTNHKHRKFLVSFVKNLEPRHYIQSSGEFIQDQYEEIFEVVFITKGSVGVGYRLFNEIFYGLQITMNKTRKVISVINDYSCLYNKCSEFLYQPIDQADAFAIRRGNYEEVMSEGIGKKLKPKIAKAYKYIIQEPLHEHRDEMALKYQNRIDYVNLSAYGAGKVKIGQEEENDDDDDQKLDEYNLESQTNTQARIFTKISNFEKRTNNICYSLSGMAMRQDERMNHIAGLVKNDQYQRNLIRKIFSPEGQSPMLSPKSAKSVRSPKSNKTTGRN